jgi:hypothetical protein
MMVEITGHAIQRYRERVEPLSDMDALAEIESHSAAIEKAAAFGCGTVILGNGARLKLKGDVVMTVLPKRGL